MRKLNNEIVSKDIKFVYREEYYKDVLRSFISQIGREGIGVTHEFSASEDLSPLLPYYNSVLKSILDIEDYEIVCCFCDTCFSYNPNYPYHVELVQKNIWQSQSVMI